MRTAIVVLLAATTLAAQPSQQMLAVTGRASSTPWVAVAGSFVAVTWSAGVGTAKSGDVFLAVSRDGGRSFAAPVRVNSIAGDARISGEIAPRVALAVKTGELNPLITVTWNAKDTIAQIRTARSRDGGRTFTDEMNLQTKGAAGERGWPASTLDARGTLHTIWLDHRAMAVKAPGDQLEHQGEHDGVAMAQKSGLYYAADGVPERELFKGVCYCCKTAIATGPTGEIYAAWRHVFAGNMRDMGFTISRDGGKTFSPLVRVNQDGWSIQGCPDDGPAMAVDAKGTVHLVWPTVKNERGVILYATSSDGRTFSTPVRIPTLGAPKPSHPQIAISGSGRIYVAWDEVRDGIRRAAIAPIDGSRAAEVIGDATSYPVMAGSGSGLVAVWTSGTPDRSTIGVRVMP
jgi:hypothetical protein